MTMHRNAARLLAGLATLSLAAPLSAAVYMKLGDIKGESQLTSLGFKGGVHVASGDIDGDGTTDNSAAGDANSDGTVDASDYTVWRNSSGTSAGNAPATPPARSKSGNITLKRGIADSSAPANGAVVRYGPVITIKPKGDHTGGPSDLKAAEDDESVALLLPAVQKVREAAARRSAGQACKLGAVHGPVTLRDDVTGGTRVIRDARVVACEPETITITFSRIDWD